MENVLKSSTFMRNVLISNMILILISVVATLSILLGIVSLVVKNKKAVETDIKPYMEILTKNFSCDVEIEIQDIEATVSIVKESENKATISFIYPSSVSGFSFTYDAGDIYASYLGMKIKMPESLPYEATAKNIFGIISQSAELKTVTAQRSGGKTYLTGKIGELPFSAEFDRKNDLVGIKVPQAGVSAEFRNFKIIE